VIRTTLAVGAFRFGTTGNGALLTGPTLIPLKQDGRLSLYLESVEMLRLGFQILPENLTTYALFLRRTFLLLISFFAQY
jgi:hypothetical protein